MTSIVAVAEARLYPFVAAAIMLAYRVKALFKSAQFLFTALKTKTKKVNKNSSGFTRKEISEVSQ